MTVTTDFCWLLCLTLVLCVVLHEMEVHWLLCIPLTHSVVYLPKKFCQLSKRVSEKSLFGTWCLFPPSYTILFSLNMQFKLARPRPISASSLRSIIIIVIIGRNATRYATRDYAANSGVARIFCARGRIIKFALPCFIYFTFFKCIERQLKF